MRRQIVRPAVLLVLAGAGLSGCSEPDTPFAVLVSPSAVTLDAVGASQQLSVVVHNEKGKELIGAAVIWTTSAATVATVSETGSVTAVGAGSADITATAGSASGKATVTVTQNATQVEATTGANQTGTVNTQLPQALTVRVRDRLGAGIAGRAVTFTVSTDGGSVSPSSATTDAQGQTSTTWTFGTKSGSYTVTATVTGAPSSVTFNGKANPGPASILSKAGGDTQYGYQGLRLDTLIAARVRDQYGNGVPSHPVQFATDAGNGTPDSAIAFTDLTGVARSGWILPGAIDTVMLRANANASGGGPLLNSPVSYTAISHNLRVQTVTPGPVVEGQSATLDGSGFDPAPTGNQVTMDGVAATVTAASAIQLAVTVPTYDCKPARAIQLRVTSGTIPASPVSVNLNPGSFVSLAAGQQTIVTNPAAFCFQFQASATAETYLIGVQSTSETHTDLTAITLAGAIPPSAASASAFSLQSPAHVRQGQAASVGAFDPAWLRRLARHRAAELEQREFDRVNFETLRARGPARAAAAPSVIVPGTASVGDTIRAVRVSTGSCSSGYAEITTVVRAKGTNLFILADSANPAGGFTDTHYNTFTQQFDEKTYPALVAEFGAPADADANSRVVAVVTREVNRRGSLGFTSSCDLSARSTAPASNEGEFFYVVAPDPTGTINNDTLSLALARELMPSTIAHEPVHVIQFTRRMAAGGPFFSIWLAEGQAVLGEEIVGHAVENRATAQNLGLTIMLNADDTLSTDWYSGGFVGLGLYFGWDPITVPSNPNGKIATAPHECTWLSTKPANQGPCVGGLDPYGAPWSLLRYLSDRFYPSNEPVFQKGLLDNTLNGYALVASLVGHPIDSLLAQWAAMLFADDSVTGVSDALKMTSWNMRDVFYGSTTYPGIPFPVGLRAALRLAPASLTYSTFVRNANVRAGSTYFAVIGGTNRPATAVKARDGAGAILAAHMRYWILRIQ